MTVSSSTNKVSYSGNGASTIFAYTFKIFDEDDLTVILRASDGVETVQTITTHYTVSGVGDAGGGNVTFVTAPASGVSVVILREQPLTQGLDLVANDPFSAENLEASLDKLTFMVQQHEEELSRVIKASKTNTITGSEFTVSAADRANKVFAFDSDGDLSITQELGTYKGDWAVDTAYVQRDIVRDTTTGSIYIINTDHTAAGTEPLNSNTNSSYYDAIFDVANTTVASFSTTGDTTIGDTNADTLTVNARILGDLVPTLSGSHRLGTSSDYAWTEAHFTNLWVHGNVKTNLYGLTEQFDLGLTTQPWRRLYATTGDFGGGYASNHVYITAGQIEGDDTLTIKTTPVSPSSGPMYIQAGVDHSNASSTIYFDSGGGNALFSYMFNGSSRLEYLGLKRQTNGVGFWTGASAGNFDTADKVLTLTTTGHTSHENFTFEGTATFEEAVTIDDNLTVNGDGATGYIRGPATFTIDPATHGDNTGTVVIAGNLQVDGTTTTVNSTQLEVDDLNITVASGAANAAAADGAGLTIDGANITLAYSDTDSVFDINYDFRVSGDLSTVNSGGYINLFEASDSSGVFTKFVDATTGKTTTDGFLIGLDSDQKAIFRNYELTDMEFATEGATRMRVGASGNLLMESGNGVRFIGASDSLFTQITRANPSGQNTVTLQDKSGTVALEDGDGNLFLKDAALISPQTDSTSSTTQKTIATFQHALWNAAKATITANDGTDTHITEMLIAHDGTTAVATEYGMVHTSASPLATYDVQISGSQLNVLATAAATTATSYTIVLTLT